MQSSCRIGNLSVSLFIDRSQDTETMKKYNENSHTNSQQGVYKMYTNIISSGTRIFIYYTIY